MDAAAAQFLAQRVGQSFEGKLRCAVGATIGERGIAQHRTVHHDAAMALAAHGRNDQIGEFDPAEQIGFELFAQRVARQVFHRADLAEAAVVEQRVELAAGHVENRRHRRADAGRIVQVEQQAFHALGAQAFDIRRLARAGEHAPATCRQAARDGGADTGGTTGDQDRFHATGCAAGRPSRRIRRTCPDS